jgi:hypothetical protein
MNDEELLAIMTRIDEELNLVVPVIVRIRRELSDLLAVLRDQERRGHGR